MGRMLSHPLVAERVTHVTAYTGARIACLAFLFPIAATACGLNGELASPRAATLRDSAGIQIVENRDPAWTDETRWTIDTVPALTIGVEEGDPILEFYKLSDVRQLEDGRIVAMNAGTNELRYFSIDGAYVCSSGRRGSGPGDFESMDWLQVLGGDTVIVHSRGGGSRLSVIDPGGVFRRTIAAPRFEDVQFVSPNGFLSERVLVMRSGRSYSPNNVTSGTHRDSSVVILVDLAGQEIGRIGPVPSAERAVISTKTMMTVTGVIFGRSLTLGYGAGRLYVGTNQRYEIAEYDTLAQLRRLIRLEREPEPVTADLIAQAESARFADAESEAARATAKALLDQMEYPSSMPYYSAMLVDSEGNLWVRQYDFFSSKATWDVFEPQGQLLGEVSMPSGFWPSVIRDREVLGIARDDLGVERVQKYRLSKPSEPEPGSAGTGQRTEAADAEPSVYRRCGTPA